MPESLFIQILLFIASSHGPSLPPVKSLPYPLAQYHHFTNQAARAIYRNDFASASIAYDSAFSYRKQPYYVDLKNFILVNHKSGHYTKNTMALLQLMTNKAIDSTQVYKDIPRRALSIENIALIRKLNATQMKDRPIASPLQKPLREMWASDQGARHYSSGQKRNKKAWEQLYIARDSTDAANFLRFEQLVSKHGFPTEEKTGVFFDDSLRWSDVITVFLLHFRLSKNDAFSMRATAIIKQALYDGHLHPAIAAEVLDRIPQDATAAYNFMSTTVNLVMEKPYRPFVFYSDSLMRAVNADRIAIGLDSFHITQQQVVCQYVGSQSMPGSTLLAMVHFANINALPPGLVNQSVKEAKVDIADYQIHTTAILEECNCELKKI